MMSQVFRGPEYAKFADTKEQTDNINSQAEKVLKKELDNSDIVEKELSKDVSNLTDTRLSENLSADDGKDIAESNDKLKPNNEFVLNGIKYETDDNGKVYCFDGKYIENSSFIIDGHEYQTNDSGEIIKKGGSYKDVKKNSDGETSEVHHMPADFASHLDKNDGPAIKMDKADHRLTASCGNSKEARDYQDAQRELIEQGKFREALQMDIDDIHDKFGDKYDDAISEMLKYVEQLEKDGKL